MPDRTYLELNQNSKKTVQVAINKDDGTPYSPSAAFCTINGSAKKNTVIPRTAALINGNKVYTKVTTVVTASASNYDIVWEIYGNDGDITFHCTELLVKETC